MQINAVHLGMSLKYVNTEWKMKDSPCHYRVAKFYQTYETHGLMVDGLLSKQLDVQIQQVVLQFESNCMQSMNPIQKLAP